MRQTDAFGIPIDDESDGPINQDAVVQDKDMILPVPSFEGQIKLLDTVLQSNSLTLSGAGAKDPVFALWGLYRMQKLVCAYDGKWLIFNVNMHTVTKESIEKLVLNAQAQYIDFYDAMFHICEERWAGMNSFIQDLVSKMFVAVDPITPRHEFHKRVVSIIDLANYEKARFYLLLAIREIRRQQIDLIASVDKASRCLVNAVCSSTDIDKCANTVRAIFATHLLNAESISFAQSVNYGSHNLFGMIALTALYDRYKAMMVLREPTPVKEPEDKAKRLHDILDHSLAEYPDSVERAILDFVVVATSRHKIL